MDYGNSTNSFSKIGGIDALHDIVDRFYDKVLKDRTVNDFFKEVNMDIQRGKMKAFLMMALGGPVKFTGKDMRKAHLRLISGGLTDFHFDAVRNHLQSALKEQGVDAAICQEIIDVFENCRTDVLNR